MSSQREQIIDNIKKTIYDNSQQKITGQILQDTLIDMSDKLSTIEEVEEVNEKITDIPVERGTGENSVQQKGTGAVASGVNSVAEGKNTIAGGIASHAEGNFTKARGDHSHAEGGNTIANGEAAHAEGYNTTASGVYSHAEGYNTKANEEGAHAEGANTVASGANSHAEGLRTETINEAEHAEGKYNKSNAGTIHSVGIGTSSKRANAFEIMQNGDAYLYGIGEYDGTNPSDAKTVALAVKDLLPTAVADETYVKKINNPFAVGDGISSTRQKNTSAPNTASGSGSVALGEGSIASGKNALSSGKSTIAAGSCAHAEGNGSGTMQDGTERQYQGAIGENAHTEGTRTDATQHSSHAEGFETQATANRAHAEGCYSIASGANSHSEGLRTTASGDNAHAEGSNSTASGESSHTEGAQTKALANHSHAGGFASEVSSPRGFVHGRNVEAKSNVEGQFAVGKYNKSNTDQILSVGIGTGTTEAQRKNAFEVMQNGDAYLYGVGGYNGTNPTQSISLQDLLAYAPMGAQTPWGVNEYTLEEAVIFDQALAYFDGGYIFPRIPLNEVFAYDDIKDTIKSKIEEMQGDDGACTFRTAFGSIFRVGMGATIDSASVYVIWYDPDNDGYYGYYIEI